MPNRSRGILQGFSRITLIRETPSVAVDRQLRSAGDRIAGECAIDTASSRLSQGGHRRRSVHVEAIKDRFELACLRRERLRGTGQECGHEAVAIPSALAAGPNRTASASRFNSHATNQQASVFWQGVAWRGLPTGFAEANPIPRSFRTSFRTT
jgi:hypothetical protein